MKNLHAHICNIRIATFLLRLSLLLEFYYKTLASSALNEADDANV